MNKLDIRKYTSTYLVSTDVAPWILNPDCLDRLKTNAAFIDYHKKIYSKGNNTWHIRSYKNSLLDFDPAQKADLSHYGVKTNQYIEGGKVSREEFNKFYETSELALCSERFFSPDYMCQGSSRHSLLYDVQLKGVGANHLNFNQDFHHRWGGFLTRDALRAIFNNEIINARTPLGASEILGLFLYKEKTFNHITECIQVRDAKSYRLAQLFPGTTVPEDRKVAQTFLDTKFNGAGPKDILSKILNHYIVSFQNGVQYRSISYDNLLLDGVFTDSESVDFTLDKSPAPQFLKIFIPKKIEVTPQALSFYTEKYDCYFYSSWAHDLRLMYHMSSLIYGEVFQSAFYDDDFFNQQLSVLGSDMFKHLLRYNSYRETDLLPHCQGDMSLMNEADLKPFLDYNMVDYYEHTFLEGTVITFCFDRKVDLRHDTIKDIDRLEVLTFDQYEKLDLAKSFENYQILKKTVNKYI